MEKTYETRSIKRLNEGFTVEPRSHLQPRPSLCESCAWVSCGTRNAITRLQNSHGVGMRLQTCPKFLYPIRFAPEAAVGFDHPRFNTMRLGSALADRMRYDDPVALISEGNEKKAPLGMVIDVCHGPVEDMLIGHAHRNHLMLHQGVDSDDAPEALRQVLINLYGKNWLANARGLSVVYIRPL